MGEITFNKIVKTRIEHSCARCNHAFPPGTQMRCITHGKEVRETVYICPTCEELGQYIPQIIKTIFTDWRVPSELSAEKFKGTPEEYLELKRAERRKTQEQ